MISLTNVPASTLGARDFSSAVSGFFSARGFGLRPTPRIPATHEKNLWYPAKVTRVSTHSPHISLKRGYKHRFIQEEINGKVRLIRRSHALKTSTRQESERVPFAVVTFNPVLPNINHIISGNPFFILHNDAKKKFLLLLLYPIAVAIIYVT